MNKIAPFLWFDDQAEEAANFYVSIFKNSKIVDIARYQPAVDRPEAAFDRGQPFGEKAKRQCVRRGEFDGIDRYTMPAAQQRMHTVDLGEHLERLFVKHFARRSEFGRVGAPIDELGADPCLECFDAPRICGLSQVSRFRGAGKAAGFRKTDKVFQPLSFHNRSFRGESSGASMNSI